MRDAPDRVMRPRIGHAHRRAIAGLAGFAAADFLLGSLYQLGVVRRLPDVPLRGFDSAAVMSSPAAHPLGIPDAPIALALGAAAVALPRTLPATSAVANRPRSALRRDQPDHARDRLALLVEPDRGVLPLHLLGDVPGERPADHRVHVVSRFSMPAFARQAVQARSRVFGVRSVPA